MNERRTRPWNDKPNKESAVQVPLKNARMGVTAAFSRNKLIVRIGKRFSSSINVMY